MIRAGSILILIISVFFMIKGISETWTSKPSSLPAMTKKQDQVKSAVGEHDLTFNPVVPSVLPDFKSGYLFNADRLLEDEVIKEVEVESDMSASGEGVKTDINGVTYSGAIISDTFRWAIITYSAAPAPPPKGAKAKRPTRRSRRPKSVKKTLETTKVMEGDLVGGYKVTSIETDRIVFAKAEETVEKYIYDPDKNRAKPPARRVTAKVPARPGVPSGVVRPPLPSAPSTKLAAKAPRSTSRAKAKTTGRRLVVSRKPPAKPDTSRVSRRRRSSGTPFGAPPVSGPPIPGH